MRQVFWFVLLLCATGGRHRGGASSPSPHSPLSHRSLGCVYGSASPLPRCVCVSICALLLLPPPPSASLSASAAELSQHASLSLSLVFYLSFANKGGLSAHLHPWSLGEGGRHGAVTSRHFGVLRTAVNRRRAPDGIGAVKPTSLTAD